MTKSRLEAFSDGVLAIIITIMVLELKVPHGADLQSLGKLAPVFFGYVLSFVYVGIYWNNHHHLLQAVKRIDGAVLWANLHLLFWLSLMPFGSGFMTENHYAPLAVAVYGVDLFMAAIAYTILLLTLRRIHKAGTAIHHASGADIKGKLSMVGYLAGIGFAAASFPVAGVVIYCAVALMWLVPDRRVERAIAAGAKEEGAEE